MASSPSGSTQRRTTARWSSARSSDAGTCDATRASSCWKLARRDGVNEAPPAVFIGDGSELLRTRGHVVFRGTLQVVTVFHRSLRGGPERCNVDGLKLFLRIAFLALAGASCDFDGGLGTAIGNGLAKDLACTDGYISGGCECTGYYGVEVCGAGGNFDVCTQACSGSACCEAGFVPVPAIETNGGLIYGGTGTDGQTYAGCEPGPFGHSATLCCAGEGKSCPASQVSPDISLPDGIGCLDSSYCGGTPCCYTTASNYSGRAATACANAATCASSNLGFGDTYEVCTSSGCADSGTCAIQSYSSGVPICSP
jgi:hypothetical protein